MSTRRPSDYRPRLIPQRESVAVPLEDARILWQRGFEHGFRNRICGRRSGWAVLLPSQEVGIGAFAAALGKAKRMRPAAMGGVAGREPRVRRFGFGAAVQTVTPPVGAPRRRIRDVASPTTTAPAWLMPPRCGDSRPVLREGAGKGRAMKVAINGIGSAFSCSRVVLRPRVGVRASPRLLCRRFTSARLSTERRADVRVFHRSRAPRIAGRSPR